MRRDHSRRLFLLLGFIVTGCASEPLRDFQASNDLVMPEPNPIAVESNQMETIAFGRTLIDIRAGATVGRVMVDDNVVREVLANQSGLGSSPRIVDCRAMGVDELRQAGYPFPSEENLLFGQDSSFKSKYLVGGTITDMVWVIHNSASQHRDQFTPMECGVEVSWQVFDTDTQQVALTLSQRGYAETVGWGQVVNASVRSSFRNLLADPEFVAAIRKKSSANPSIHPAQRTPLTLAAPRNARLQLPQQMQMVTNAVVTLRVGSVHGSGFFVTSDGYLLTAAHVVAGRDTCRVKLGDGREIEARVCRIDEGADVALLKVADGNYPALQLAAGPSPSVGTEVYAIGTPLVEELDRSVSKGIVSALRHIGGTETIQTDAAINGKSRCRAFPESDLPSPSTLRWSGFR
jgi:serine protease Do